MKKSIVIISGVILLIIVLFFITAPVLFKPALINATKSSIEKELNAQVEFGAFKLSLFRNFPRLSLELKNVAVMGKGEFQADTVLKIENAVAKLNMWSLFKKSGRSIDEIKLEKPVLNLIVGKTGNENWDFTGETATVQEPETMAQTEKQEEPFTLKLDNIQIQNATLKYSDRETELVQQFDSIDVFVKGKMYGNSADLNFEGTVGRYLIDYKGSRYLSDVSIETKTKLNVDFENLNFSIVENELLLNRLPLQVTGSIQMPSDSIFFDLEVKTKNSDFENFLALIPPGYEEYLDIIKTSGSAAVSGTIKGLYFNEIYPAIDLKIDVANGNLKYPELPDEIKKINANILVSKPVGELDLTDIGINSAHFEIKNNPVDLTLKMKNLFTDPWFDGAFVGAVNFDQLKDALPLKNVNISGTIDAYLFVKGNYSSVEKEEYDKLNVSGIVLLDNFLYDSPALNQKILVPAGKLDFTPQSVNLSRFDMKLGQSDFKLNGKVFNYLNYFLKDGIISGDLQLVSSFVNINELLRLQKKKKSIASDDNKTGETTVNSNTLLVEEKLVFDIPKDIDFTFRSKIDKAIFDKLAMSEISGLITAKNGKLILNGLNMHMLDGELKLSGSYENTQQNQPLVEFSIDMNGFDIPVAFQSLSGFQKMAPIAGQSRGKVNSSLKMKGQMTRSFKLIPASVDGTGFFGTQNLVITDSPVFKELKGIIKSEKLQNVTIDDFTANFKIDDGNIDLKPFNMKVAGQEANVSGALSADNLINMRMDFKINRDAFGPDVQNILSVIPGNKNISMLPAGVNISGPVGKPEVKMDLSEATKIVTKVAKEGFKDSVNQLGKELKKLFGK